MNQTVRVISNLVAIIMILSYFLFYRREKKYLMDEFGKELKRLVPLPVSVVSGCLLLAVAIFGNVIPSSFFRKIFKESSAVVAIPVWIIMMTIGFLFMYVIAMYCMRKYNIPVRHKQRIAAILFINSGWYGVAFAWGVIAFVVVIILAFFLIMLRSSSSGNTNQKRCSNCGAMVGKEQTECPVCGAYWS